MVQQHPAFDLGNLRSHLPQGQSQAQPPGAVQQPAWADGFSGNAQGSAKGKARADNVSNWGGEFDSSQRASPLSHEAQVGRTASPPSVAPWQRPGFAQQGYAQPGYAMQSRFGMQQGMYQQPQMHHQPPMHQHQQPMNSPPLQKAVPQPPVQQAETKAQEPLNQSAPQDELARTAQALVDQLDKESMSNNSKLAGSQFVKLLRGLGDGSVVVKDGTGAVKEGTEVSDGAKFVSTAGGDWANDFVAEVPMGTQTPNYEVHSEQMGPGWAEQIQAALTMDDAGRPVARRKSVHFDEPTVGVPRNLEEAMQSHTAVPGVGASWEDPGMEEEWDDEEFIHFNGPRVAEAPAGPSEQEAWGIDQEEMDKYEDRTDEPYLFHRANPYTLGAPIEREMSPTTMVGGGLDQVLTTGRAGARSSSAAGSTGCGRVAGAGFEAAGERARGGGHSCAVAGYAAQA